MTTTNIPNILTLFRIILIPAFVLFFYLPLSWKPLITAAIFGIAALTDWLDGYLARRLGQTSAFGAFLDPVADKLMVVVALVLLVGGHGTPWLAIPAAVIIGREIVVSALREWMAELGQRATVSVATVGKFKTIFQMVAIFIMLLGEPSSEPLVWHDESLLANLPLFEHIIYTIGFILLYVAALLTLWSMAIYLYAARESVAEGKP
uniref:CDP-diacylglycerol--glycerol-3-phosphate 3-phosphatidyltransferase n=1 Tax=Candidatus Kentrum sp. LFY TaxID=2126342 RepID=A0A450V4H0_9GAMM|nr:MAG: CDP-diacylglycerol--glycerol-3-phosphate 3-phosphatidyltransferase [Candidatus Kentron sp. LFY]VFJ99659.1 MAG: CDP-diacylglycerol--glycerol-3-phosphate 3-phosphatidyltransferase [Candidatus Kentron sp. LFY]VFK22144.1 MAG: CDP-diacylglycerol--glycerol-3-phosphate 3-phosphatidyltransferase [Candidatus Kentron sp. LFY]